MLVQTRPISVTIAVLCFFAVGIVGSLAGLAPGTCCKRAVLGAAIGYVAAGAAVRAINTILTQAMIASRIHEEDAGDREG